MNSKEAGTMFYDKLFSLDPSLKPLFRENPATQAQKLVSMITFVVHKLNNLSEIIKDVEALGQRHRNYKVRPEHYKTVAEALLWTLEKGMGDDWSAELREAWVEVYSVLSRTMIASAEKIQGVA
jgi:hemoglobin-like flavoprotein